MKDPAIQPGHRIFGPIGHNSFILKYLTITNIESNIYA
jgi:hypothetical protein